MAKAKRPQIIAIEAPITITAAAPGAEGESKVPAFDVVAYTGGAMNIAGWDVPVVIDLKGVKFGNSIIANLDHDSRQRVGHVTEKAKADGQITLGGKISAATDAAREVVESAANGFIWQASVEVTPDKIVEVAAGKIATVNGQEFTGPLYVAAKSTLKGFAFVSHGADDNTTVAIAASAANDKEKTMRPEVQTWVKALLPSLDIDAISAEEATNLERQYDGLQPGKTKPTIAATNPFDARKAEAKRRREIREIADRHLELRDSDEEEIIAVEHMHEHAIKTRMTPQEFRLELYDASVPLARTVPQVRDRSMNDDVVKAAICMSGRLEGHEKMFPDQVLQLAHDHFPRGIGLKQLFLICAQSKGYHNYHSNEVTIDVQRAAFGMLGPRQIQASGFSTLSIGTIVSATANKFLREGWMAVDQTPMRIAAIRNVNDFKQITTVSLTGDLQFEKLGSTGEIKHGTLGEETYTNQADTYARMLAITRKDIINDDLNALTAIPRRLGRGAMLKLNDIFWTAFLNNSAFFTTARLNVNEGVADMTLAGLAATELIFMSQTDADGKPLGLEPRVLLVPTALKAAAQALMESDKIIDGTSTTKQGDANIYKNRFRVESSPYMHNTSYTGYSAAAWYMLADPQAIPVVEIAALNGRVEPTVETADADFNVLGVQMRGYSDVGVTLQEYRGGVRADGGTS